MKVLSRNIIKKLSKKKLKISFAESCTGGLLSSAITSISGASKIFSLGLVYIGIKMGNKVKINKYLFKNKGRSYIQRSAVNKTLKLILSILK